MLLGAFSVISFLAILGTVTGLGCTQWRSSGCSGIYKYLACAARKLTFSFSWQKSIFWQSVPHSYLGSHSVSMIPRSPQRDCTWVAGHKLDLIHLSSSGKTQGSGQSACGHTTHSANSWKYVTQDSSCHYYPAKSWQYPACNKDAILVFSKD